MRPPGKCTEYGPSRLNVDIREVQEWPARVVGPKYTTDYNTLGGGILLACRLFASYNKNEKQLN